MGTQTNFQSTNNQQFQRYFQSTNQQEQQTTPTGVTNSSQQTVGKMKTPSNTFCASMIRGNDSLT